MIYIRKNRYNLVTSIILQCQIALEELMISKWKLLFPISYILLFISIEQKINSIEIGWLAFHHFIDGLLHSIITAVLSLGFIIVIILIGRPFKTRKIENMLSTIGFVNKKGDTPLLYCIKEDSNRNHGKIFEFLNNGTPLEDWQFKTKNIETAINYKIYNITYGKNGYRGRIKVYALPIKYDLPTIISIEDDYLSNMINCLVVGATGTGKSYCLQVLLGKITNYVPNVSITICDYKRSSFACYEDTLNFFGYEDSIKGINKVYQEFQQRLELNDIGRNSEVQILVIDEYGALISAQDKINANEIKTKISNMLFMGRSLGIRLIIGIQRADAEYFRSGARDQFRNIIALGNLSREQKQMLFADYKEQITNNSGLGEGYLLIDGKGIEKIKVASILNNSEVEYKIREAMYR